MVDSEDQEKHFFPHQVALWLKIDMSTPVAGGDRNSSLSERASKERLWEFLLQTSSSMSIL